MCIVLDMMGNGVAVHKIKDIQWQYILQWLDKYDSGDNGGIVVGQVG